MTAALHNDVVTVASAPKLRVVRMCPRPPRPRRLLAGSTRSLSAPEGTRWSTGQLVC